MVVEFDVERQCNSLILLAKLTISRLLTRHFPPGGGTPHMKGVGMLVGNFELNA